MSLEGQVADEEFESEDLEVEPYAEDMPFEPARVRVPRWLLVGIIIALIVALLVLMAIGFARGSWWYPPQPTISPGTSVPFFTLVP
jgi:fatty acid desaturase